MKLILAYTGLLLLLLLAVTVTVYAAEPLTLDQAIETALKNHPGLKAADAQVEAAQAGITRSRSGFLPKVNLSETWRPDVRHPGSLGTRTETLKGPATSEEVSQFPSSLKL
jgi:outer membrane protein TolC